MAERIFIKRVGSETERDAVARELRTVRGELMTISLESSPIRDRLYAQKLALQKRLDEIDTGSAERGPSSWKVEV